MKKAPTRTTLYATPGPSVEFYDAFHELGKVPPIEGDVDFYLREAYRWRGPILELACGTGRISLPLAIAGFDVTGLDIAAPMLDIARRKAKAKGLSVKFVKGSMRKFRFNRKFRLILIPFRSFQSLLTPEEQRDCLACIRRHLTPGGRAIINLFDPRLEYCVDGETAVMSRYRAAKDPATGREARLHVLRRTNDALNQILREDWDFTVRDRRGKVIERSSRHLAIRWTYRWEMQHLLELEGFAVDACYGDFYEGPAKHGGEQVWVVNKRR